MYIWDRNIPPTAASSISMFNCSAINPMMANITKPAKNDVPQFDNVTTTESLRREKDNKRLGCYQRLSSMKFRPLYMYMIHVLIIYKYQKINTGIIIFHIYQNKLYQVVTVKSCPLMASFTSASTSISNVKYAVLCLITNLSALLWNLL